MKGLKNNRGRNILLGHRAWLNVFATWSVINFTNFKLYPVILGTKNQKLFTSFLGYKVIFNEVEIANPKDVYLPRNITNDNVCALFSAGLYFLFEVILRNHNMLNFSHNFHIYHRLLHFLYTD